MRPCCIAASTAFVWWALRLLDPHGHHGSLLSAYLEYPAVGRRGPHDPHGHHGLPDHHDQNPIAVY